MESTKPIDECFDYIDIDAIDNKLNIINKPKHILSINAPSRATRKISEGDVLFSIVRPYLKNVALVTKTYEKCIASTGFYVCKPYNIISSNYLFYYLISPKCINGVMPFMKGDNSPSIKNDNLENLVIAIPSRKEQERIISKLNFLYEKINF